MKDQVRQGVSIIKANRGTARGKAALALASLAAAGGLGTAGMKAVNNARKPKSLQDRIKKASKKMFK